jgi:hypothetical protein
MATDKKEFIRHYMDMLLVKLKKEDPKTNDEVFALYEEIELFLLPMRDWLKLNENKR